MSPLLVKVRFITLICKTLVKQLDLQLSCDSLEFKAATIIISILSLRQMAVCEHNN